MEETKKITRTDFFKAIGYEPHEGQKAVHESGARYRIVTCGRRGGKSEMLAAEAAFRLLAGQRILVLSAYKAVRERLIERVAECLDKAGSLMERRVSVRYLIERGAALDAGFPDASLSGSKGYDLVISKEISQIKDNPAPVIVALVAEREGIWLEAGTARIDPPKWYREIVEKAITSRGKWAYFSWASDLNPSLPEEFTKDMREAMLGDIARAELSGEIVTTQSKSQD